MYAVHTRSDDGFSSLLHNRDSGADLGFWFGRGIGRGLGDRSLPAAGFRRRAPVGSGGDPPEARKMLRHEANKTTYGERKNKSIQTDIVRQYHNYQFIISSLVIFCFQPFLS